MVRRAAVLVASAAGATLQQKVERVATLQQKVEGVKDPWQKVEGVGELSEKAKVVLSEVQHMPAVRLACWFGIGFGMWYYKTQ